MVEKNSDLKQSVQKLNSRLIIWTTIFFGLMIQTIQSWNWFFRPGNYWVFLFIVIWFLIGFAGFKVFKMKLNKIGKTHAHKYDASYHCEICGIYWDLKSCVYCNSKKILYSKKSEDFGYFKRNINAIECEDCGKVVEIDSYSTVRPKGVKTP